jgi:hypothetical protein
MTGTGTRARRQAISCAVAAASTTAFGRLPTAPLLRHGYGPVVTDLCTLTGIDANTAFLDAAPRALAVSCHGSRRLEQACAGAFAAIDSLLGTDATFEHRHVVVAAATARCTVALPRGCDPDVAAADIGHLLAALRVGEAGTARELIELGAQLRRTLTVEALCRSAASAQVELCFESGPSPLLAGAPVRDWRR